MSTDVTDACCTPGRPHDPEAARGARRRPDACHAGHRARDPRATFPVDAFLMGDDSVWAYPDDGEGPVHEVEVRPLRVDAYTVSNARFAEFVDATGHRTDAERYEWSFVFAGFLPDDFPDTRARRQRAVVAAGVRRRLASSRRARTPISTAAPTIRSSTCRGTTRARTARGRAPAFRPKRSGSTRRAAAASGTRSRGATTSSPTASTA